MAQTWGGLSSLINVNELTEVVRHAAQPIKGIAQLASPPTGKALGLNAGDTCQFEWFPNMTTSGGVLSETEEIPSGSITPIKSTYTVSEYGNSLKYTGLLENLAKLPITDSFMKALMDDLQKLQNTACYTALKATAFKIQLKTGGNTFTNAGTTSGVNDKDLDLAGLGYIRKQARKNLIAPFDGESYVYVTGVDSTDALGSDSNLTNLLKEESGRASLNNEIGRVKQCRVIEDNHAIGTAGTSAYNEGLLVGADALINEVALPWEVRLEVKDFGRSKAVAYYGIMAFVKPVSYSTHSQENCIHVTSA